MPQHDLTRGARRIVCLGDSITQMGDAPNGWVDIVRRSLLGRGIEVINAGIGGHTSGDMRARFARDVLRLRPDLVTISCGINDVSHGFDAFHPDGGGPRSVPLPAFRQNVQAMVESAQGERVTAVVLSTTVIEEEANSKGNLLLRDYNAVLEHVAGVTDSRFIPLQQPFLHEIARVRHETGSNRLVLTTDGCHLNERGNALMAKLVLEGLGGGDTAIS